MKKKRTYRTVTLLTLMLMAAGGVVTQVYSHCQIPCGIYDDDARLKEIAEHLTTIEKGMKQIEELSKADPKNMNQIVRWVNNKEDHASQLNEIVTYYFMAQRITPAEPDSPDYKNYIEQLTLLHKMQVTAMKCKQTTDLANVKKLRDLLHDFSHAYSK
jgi:nickel superoxide dismutase